MTCWAASLVANFLSLAKALACPTARQMTIFLLIFLLVCLGRSNFCNWAKEELIFCSAINLLTSAGEPSIRVFRVMLTPGGAEKSLTLLKQDLKISGDRAVTVTRAARKMTEKWIHVKT